MRQQYNDGQADIDGSMGVQLGHIDPARLSRASFKLGKKQPQSPVHKPQLNIMKIRDDYKDLRREFKMENYEAIELSELILKETITNRKFAAFSKKSALQVAIQGENEVKMAIQKTQDFINMEFEVMPRYGTKGFKVKDWVFDKYNYQLSSIQFQLHEFQYPDNCFFLFEARKGSSSVINSIKDLIGDGTTKEKSFFAKTIKQIGFQDLAHIILDETYLPKHCKTQPQLSLQPSPQFTRKWTQDNNLVPMYFVTEQQVYQPLPRSYYLQDISYLHQMQRKRGIHIKQLMIYSQEVQIGSDIRNILSAKKIYLIQIMEESKSAVSLAETVESRLKDIDITIIREIYQILVSKTKEFLLAVCTFLPSQIQIDLRVRSLLDYLRSNFMYSDSPPNPTKGVLKSSPILQSWFSIPEDKGETGYTVQELRDQIYLLIRKSCMLKRQIEYHQQYVQMQVAIGGTLNRNKNRPPKLTPTRLSAPRKGTMAETT